MNRKICLATNTLYYPQGGGHLWVYLNWALGLRALGYDVCWLERVKPETTDAELQGRVDGLNELISPYGLSGSVTLCCRGGSARTFDNIQRTRDIAEAATADLLLNLAYGVPANVVGRFQRSALVDIDPGLTQLWLSANKISLAPHDIYFSIGETVGRADARFPDCGIEWHYTPPCVALDWWPPRSAPASAPFTTVTHWMAAEWIKENGGTYANDKRTGFQPFLDLPRHTSATLELALALGGDTRERAALEQRGWRIRRSVEVASRPRDYQRYIQQSRGEFSCVKPSCVRLQNAWVSDRTLCYLASGKPAIVQHTGPSRFLPDAAGLFRFRTLEEAVRHLQTVTGDYEAECRNARALAEQCFDAKQVAAAILEKALL